MPVRVSVRTFIFQSDIPFAKVIGGDCSKLTFKCLSSREREQENGEASKKEKKEKMKDDQMMLVSESGTTV